MLKFPTVWHLENFQECGYLLAYGTSAKDTLQVSPCVAKERSHFSPSPTEFDQHRFYRLAISWIYKRPENSTSF